MSTHKNPAAVLENRQHQARTDSCHVLYTVNAIGREKARAGQGRVQWLVVVVAARETVSRSWLDLPTVDSLSLVDLTSQGFFYIPACACVNLCVGAWMCAPKRGEKFVC